MNMGVEELKKYSDYAKKLTSNDVTRIEKLILKYSGTAVDNGNASNSVNSVRREILETLRFMLANNVKLEQEAL